MKYVIITLSLAQLILPIVAVLLPKDYEIPSPVYDIVYWGLPISCLVDFIKRGTK